MPTSYFKRLRMEINLRRAALPEPLLPEGYRWREWHPVLTEAHARAKYDSFRDEADSLLFPCLATVAGCRKLMRDISLRRGFLPAATWLICVDTAAREKASEGGGQRSEGGGQRSEGGGQRSEPADPASEAFGPVPCGTIQGVVQGWRVGSIQNVGIIPTHRGLGLGRALLLKSLHGFKRKRIRRVYLEVTAGNEPAIALYQSVGFVHKRTSYRSVDVDDVLLPAS